MAKPMVRIEPFRVFDTKYPEKQHMRRDRLAQQPSAAHGISTNSSERSTATIRSALSRNATPLHRFTASGPLTVG